MAIEPIRHRIDEIDPRLPLPRLLLGGKRWIGGTEAIEVIHWLAETRESGDTTAWTP